MKEKENIEIRFLGDLHRLQVLPGDVFVITCEQILTLKKIDEIRIEWNGILPSHKLIVLDGGLKLCVLNDTDKQHD